MRPRPRDGKSPVTDNKIKSPHRAPRTEETFRDSLNVLSKRERGQSFSNLKRSFSEERVKKGDTFFKVNLSLKRRSDVDPF